MGEVVMGGWLLGVTCSASVGSDSCLASNVFRTVRNARLTGSSSPIVGVELIDHGGLSRLCAAYCHYRSLMWSPLFGRSFHRYT